VELARSVDGLTHRLDRIDDQIDDHLLQLDLISRDERQAVRNPCLPSDLISLQLGLGQGGDFADHLAEV
jgi:hypothetical protein